MDQDDLPGVVTSASMFGNDHPLEIEIGSGKGLFLATAAGHQPASNFLGIEIVPKYAALAAARVVKAGRGNAKVVAGDAGPVLSKLVPDRSVSAIHVYFPDPWWKRRHRQRRVVSRDSVIQFARVLVDGGRLHFWTDVLDYFEDTVEMIAELTPQFGVPRPEKTTDASHDLDYRTHFERRSRQHQIPVYRVRYTLSVGSVDDVGVAGRGVVGPGSVADG